MLFRSTSTDAVSDTSDLSLLPSRGRVAPELERRILRPMSAIRSPTLLYFRVPAGVYVPAPSGPRYVGTWSPPPEYLPATTSQNRAPHRMLKSSPASFDGGSGKHVGI